jgi:hypothetical protein
VAVQRLLPVAGVGSAAEQRGGLSARRLVAGQQAAPVVEAVRRPRPPAA